ncbi:hypothetical protein PJM41_0011 [Salmonella phage vB_SenS_UTK0009]|uniref:Uncharacterized protein n=1 Tax=Salmonella phage vB_SenS_UTK0009 TaxID=3028908 RepID=A0AAF0CCV4_9CAUD|nr:hypothetical protein PJM41_0011 [Salmonella phage vB_SenS_UTK0009]
MSQEKYGFSLENVNTAKHDMIILADCPTGYCGEGWTEEYFVPAGCDLDAFGDELAYDNASRFGSDGYEDEETGEWIENDNYYAGLYHYQLSRSGIYVNGGDPINNVMKLIIEHGGAEIVGNKAIIYANRLKQLVYIPDATRWDEYAVLHEEMKRCFNVEALEIS